MAEILTIPSRVQRVFTGERNLSAIDRARVDSREVLSADARGLPTAMCIARCTQWQDNGNYPGWELEPDAGGGKILAGTVWASALEDGGWIRIFCTGTWLSGTSATGNPTLLFRVQAWSDYWNPGGPTGSTTIGPGAVGWGFTDGQTGATLGNTLADSTTRRFVFDVELHSLGKNASTNVLSRGSILVSPLIGADGYGDVTPLPTQYEYKILGAETLDLELEYEWTLNVSSTSSVTNDAIHIDKAEMWLFGARHGLEVLD